MGRRISLCSNGVRQYFEIGQLESICTLCTKVVPGHHTGNLRRHIERRHGVELLNESGFEAAAVQHTPEKSIVKKRHKLSSSKRSLGNYSRNQEPEEEEEEEADEKIVTVKLLSRDEERMEIVHDDEDADVEGVIHDQTEESWVWSTKRELVEMPHTKAASNEPRISLDQLNLTAESVQEIYMDMVVQDGFPIHFPDQYSALQRILTPLNQALNVSVSTKSLSKGIVEKAKGLREEIKQDLLGASMVSFSIDAVDKLRLVWIHYYSSSEERIVSRLLGDVQPSPGTSNIAAVVEHNLKYLWRNRYGIDESHAYAVLLRNVDEVGEVVPFSLVSCLATAMERTIVNEAVARLAATPEAVTEEIAGLLKELKKKRTIEGLLMDLRGWRDLDVVVEMGLGEWQVVEQIIQLLEDAQQTCLVNLKSRDSTKNKRMLLLTDRMAIVYKYLLKLQSSPSVMVQTFHKHLQQRFSQYIAAYPPVVAALFLDPRYQPLLTADERALAKQHLIALFKRSRCYDGAGDVEVKGERVERPQHHHDACCGDDVDHGSEAYLRLEDGVQKVDEDEGEEQEEEDDDLFTSYLLEKAKGQTKVTMLRIERVLDEFDGTPILPARRNVLAYWNAPDRDPMLRKLAHIVLAMPCTMENRLDEDGDGKAQCYQRLENAIASNRKIGETRPNLMQDLLLVVGSKAY